MSSVSIVFSSLGGMPPTQATQGSAGHDCEAYLPIGQVVTIYGPTGVPVALALTQAGIVLRPQDRALIPLGFKAQLPEGYEAQIRPRSGRALKEGLIVVNSPGTIDSDYGEEWGVIVGNIGEAPIQILHGDRIAQMVVQPVCRVKFVLDTITNSRSGFGSTGR